MYPTLPIEAGAGAGAGAESSGLTRKAHLCMRVIERAAHHVVRVRGRDRAHLAAAAGDASAG